MNKFPVCPIFIQANRLEWINKTFDKGADAVIIDLEDSVPNDQKVETRTNLLRYLESRDFDKTILIRINPLDSKFGEDDINLLSGVSSKIDALYEELIELIAESDEKLLEKYFVISIFALNLTTFFQMFDKVRI